jgi:hypothetical protein
MQMLVLHCHVTIGEHVDECNCGKNSKEDGFSASMSQPNINTLIPSSSFLEDELE